MPIVWTDTMKPETHEPHTCHCHGNGSCKGLPAAVRLDLRTAREAAMEALESYAESLSDPVLEHLIYGSHHAATALIELLDRPA